MDIYFSGYLYMVRKILVSNESIDWTVGVVRPSLKGTWPIFLAIHLIVAVIGLFGSISMLADIICTRLYKNNTGAYLLNLVINNLLVLLVQMPLNFFIMLYENWVIGEVMCYVSAIVPYLLLQCSLLTFIFMSVDRYRSIAHPSKKQLNVYMCLITVWITSACAAAPMVTYMHYIHVGHLESRLENNGLCWTTGDDYSKIVLVTVFTGTAVVLALILVKTSAELKTKSAMSKLHERQSNLQEKCTDNIQLDSDVDSCAGEDLNEKYKQHEWIEGEKTTQRFLTIMTCLWMICWLPMKIFGTITTNTVETAENEMMFDVAPMILLPISALSSITTPVCFVLMKKKTLMQSKRGEESEDRGEEYDNKSLMYSSSLKMHDQFASLDTRQYF